MGRAAVAVMLLVASGCQNGELLEPDTGQSSDADTSGQAPIDGGDSADDTVSPAPDGDAVSGDTSTPGPSDGGDGSDTAEADTTPPAPDCQGPAYLHGNVWAFWYNYRVMCDYEHKKYWRCQQTGGDCAEERQAWESCDVCRQQDGICIPRTRPGASDSCCDESACCDYEGPGPPDEETHFWGNFRSCRTDCDTRDYDYDQMEGHFYGKTWSGLGDWSLNFRDADGNPITDQIVGGTKGEDSEPPLDPGDALGYFGCYQLPVGEPITIKISLHDWQGEPATKPRDYLEQTITPKAGTHYVWTKTGLAPWSDFDRGNCVGPPASIADRLGGPTCSTAP